MNFKQKPFMVIFLLLVSFPFGLPYAESMAYSQARAPYDNLGPLQTFRDLRLIELSQKINALMKQAESIKNYGPVDHKERQELIIEAYRLELDLLIEIGVLPRPKEGKVVSLLNGVDFFLFEKVRGYSVDSRAQKRNHLKMFFGEIKRFDLKKVAKWTIRRNALAAENMVFQEDISALKKWMEKTRLEPSAFVLKNTESHFRPYEAPNQYEAALENFIRNIAKETATFVIIGEKNDLTKAILEANGYQNIFPELLPKQAFENLEEVFNVTDNFGVNGFALELGGPIQVFRKIPENDAPVSLFPSSFEKFPRIRFEVPNKKFTESQLEDLQNDLHYSVSKNIRNVFHRLGIQHLSPEYLERVFGHAVPNAIDAILQLKDEGLSREILFSVDYDRANGILYLSLENAGTIPADFLEGWANDSYDFSTKDPDDRTIFGGESVGIPRMFYYLLKEKMRSYFLFATYDNNQILSFEKHFPEETGILRRNYYSSLTPGHTLFRLTVHTKENGNQAIIQKISDAIDEWLEKNQLKNTTLTQEKLEELVTFLGNEQKVYLHILARDFRNTSRYPLGFDTRPRIKLSSDERGQPSVWLLGFRPAAKIGDGGEETTPHSHGAYPDPHHPGKILPGIAPNGAIFPFQGNVGEDLYFLQKDGTIKIFKKNHPEGQAFSFPPEHLHNIKYGGINPITITIHAYSRSLSKMVFFEVENGKPLKVIREWYEYETGERGIYKSA